MQGESFCAKTRFDTEAKYNSEIAYSLSVYSYQPSISWELWDPSQNLFDKYPQDAWEPEELN